ncbi:SSI family serine proteinase inhibitor [Streptomyces sp. NPDC048290]|uniref:SSI family serine proteinase inhibitor n=1 Tax=Streptomyces sp. NPDC048290 TaxID=3155811 RepID=UPI00343EF688
MSQVTSAAAPSRLPSRHPYRLPSRRLLLVAGLVLASLSGVAPVSAAVPAIPSASSPALPPPVRLEDRVVSGRLDVVVEDADGRVTSYDVSCAPDGGSHPDVRGACAAVEREMATGRDPFTAVAAGSACTMVYGGTATAHVTGTWSGRRVDARFDRTNGCEIDRWNRLVPLLPDLRG